MSMGALAVVRGKTGLLSGGFKVGAGGHDKHSNSFKVGAEHCY